MSDPLQILVDALTIPRYPAGGKSRFRRPEPSGSPAQIPARGDSIGTAGQFDLLNPIPAAGRSCSVTCLWQLALSWPLPICLCALIEWLRAWSRAPTNAIARTQVTAFVRYRLLRCRLGAFLIHTRFVMFNTYVVKARPDRGTGPSHPLVSGLAIHGILRYIHGGQ